MSSNDSGILRTPDSAFVNLLDYPFKPNYIELTNPGSIGNGQTKIRLHYLDEGNRTSKETILLLHGEPTWSYLYRHFIPLLNQYRIIVPDLIGFGKSDKPAHKNDYTYQRHVHWIQQFIQDLNLNQITLFCQDWGSLIGLQLVGTNGMTDRFSRVIVANGGLPTGDAKISEAFIRWQKFASEQTEMDIGTIIQFGTIRQLNDKEIEAYNAPFPDGTYQSGALAFPLLVPTTPSNPSSQFNRQAWNILNQFSKPFLTLFSDSDPITAGADKVFQSMIPGAKHQKHSIIQQGGHFLQEDQPNHICQHITRFIEENPLSFHSNDQIKSNL